MANSGAAIVLGTASFATFSTETISDMLDILQKHNVKQLDTASLYQGSEAVLGKHGAPKRFTIHTKAPGFRPGSMSKQGVLDGMKKSLEDLGVDSVDIYYLHAPDPKTPIEDTLSAISQLYKEGKFKRFGLSNYTAAGVQEIYDIQIKNNAVLPTVFQGNYNAVSRHIEADLFPLLHKLKINFYAYSPIAGGFLVKDVASLRAQLDSGRFGVNSRAGAMYNHMYGKESLYKGLEEWEQIAQDAGISKVALAYRWITYHSALKKDNGDAVIVGASKASQLEESLEAIEKGPLDAQTVKRVDEVWEKVKDDAPLDNYHSYAATQGLSSRGKRPFRQSL